jgi:PAS domain S-box-containing protein
MKSSNHEIKEKAFIHADIFERITDAFIALDNNFCYIYINKKAGEISGRNPASLIGKNIWKEFPKEVANPFFHAVHEAMKTQHYVYVENFYQETGKWFENHIYPSKEGVSIYFRDITDKKKMEIALKQNEEKYRSIIEQSNDGIFILDPEGKILEVNSSACRISGYEKQELLNKTLFDLVLLSSDQRPPELFRLEKDRSIYPEEQLLKNDGAIIFVEVSSQMTPDGKIVMFVREITERKKTERELREAEEKFRNLVETSPVGVYIIQDGKFAYVNPIFAYEFGYAPNELIGCNIEISAKDEEEMKKVNENIRLRLSGEKNTAHYEMTGRKKDGSLIEVEVFGSRTLYQGKPAIIGTLINITKRKKIELERREAEEKFRDLVEKSLVGVYIIQDRKFAYVNPRFAEIFGYTRDELIGKDIDTMGKDKKEMTKANEYIRQRLSGEKASVHYEYNGLKKDGSLVQVEILGTQTQYRGHPAIIGTLLDITDQKKAVQELNEAEQKFRDLIEKSLVGVYIIQNGTFAYVNPKLAEIFDYTQQELVGAKVRLLINGDEEMKKVAENIRQRLNGEKDSVHYEFVGQRKDGTPLQIEVFGSRTQYKGGSAIIGTLIDITERKQAEEKLRDSEQKYKLLFESNPLPMWMFSKENFAIIDVNQAACKHYGYTRKEFLKMNIKDMRPPEDIPHFLEKISERKPKNVSMGRWRHRKKDGSIITVEIIGNDIVYQGKVVRLSLANDITEKVAAEERLKQSYEEIRQLTKHLQNIREEERTHIAREIHDELGQQLTVLKMDISWVLKKFATDDTSRKKLQDMMDVLDHTVKTVRHIASELRPTLLDDLGLIPAIEWHLKEFEERCGIKTELKAPGKELLLADAVKIGLFRIFQESLTNVARHSKAKKVKISLSIKKERIVLRIEDDGLGFDEEKISRKRTLGILGMKERSAMIGGNYEINSIPGKGTTVVVSVPINQRNPTS